jgi:hypothetical protein
MYLLRLGDKAKTHLEKKKRKKERKEKREQMVDADPATAAGSLDKHSLQ